MAKPRFRNIKQGKTRKPDEKKTAPTHAYAKAFTKIKAFLTDSFLLLMPIMYIVFYLVMGSREAFREHMLMGWIYILVPLVIVQTLFMAKSGQTPGFRNYNLEIIDDVTGKRPGIGMILFRNLCAILSFFTIVGWVMMFFRKDAKTLHDLLSRTAIVNKS